MVVVNKEFEPCEECDTTAGGITRDELHEGLLIANRLNAQNPLETDQELAKTVTAQND